MSIKTELEQFPYVNSVASLLEQQNPGSTLFDLRDELQQSLEAVASLMNRYGESVKLTDTTTAPVDQNV